MKRIFIRLYVLTAIFTIGCKKSETSYPLKGKIKSLEIIDVNTGARRMLNYYYDSDKNLKSSEGDSLKFIIDRIDAQITKVQLTVLADDPNFNSRQLYIVHTNTSNQIESVNLLDTLTSEETNQIKIAYNSILIADTVTESGQPVFVHDVSNFNYLFDGNNYVKQKVSGYKYSFLGGETYYLDSITYSYSDIPNNNFIPLQQPFLGTAYALTGNTNNNLLLYLLDINGYSVYKRNANLIKSVCSANYGYIINYNYTLNPSGQVVEMAASNSNGTGTYMTYRMTYY
ncbi:MAG: hypothetical protein IPM95_15515 [Sphingobacteriales bacterium]|nr:hypothetical protein [Sphingobacteriales bacterium]